MKFSIYDESGELKSELKIGMAIDDYKLKNKEEWWRKCLAKIPDIEKHYDFVREEVGAGVTTNTVTCYRFFKLRDLNLSDGDAAGEL